MKELKTQRNKSTTGKYLPQAQLKKLLQFVKKKSDLARERGTTRAVIDELIVLLLVNTGLRPRELCNLNIRDLPVHHGKNILNVRDDNGNIVRHIDISTTIANFLQRFVRLYRKAAKPYDPLLINERGNRFTYISVYSKIKSIGEKALIGKLHPYMLRRTFMVNLYNAQRDLRFVQEQAGHASYRTTAMYARSNSDCKQEFEAANQADCRAINLTDDFLKACKQKTICEGCDKPLLNETGSRIDSGQIICNECLRYFRNT